MKFPIGLIAVAAMALGVVWYVADAVSRIHLVLPQ